MKRTRKPGRFLAALLAAVMLLAPAVTAHAASVSDFSDVNSGDWFYDAVDYVVGKGLFNGASSTRFNPNGRMTRGMFITVLGRYAGVNASAWLSGTVTGSEVNLRSGPGTDQGIVGTLDKNADVTILGKSKGWYKVQTAVGTGYVSADYLSPDRHVFSDVDYSQYYAGYAVWAYEKGIVNGNGSSDKFTPDSNITREQMCTILDRFADVMGASPRQTEGAVTFPDGGKISSWAADSVSAMQQAGVVQGDAQGNFRPRGSATRAETAAMLQRFDTACGGFVAPDQDPPAKQQSGGQQQEGGGSAPPTVPSAPPADPGEVEDTPATIIDGAVSTKGSKIRVGIYYKTNDYDTSVDSVTLANSSGFALGTMSGRDFVADGNVIYGSPVTITVSGDTFTVSSGSDSFTYAGAFAVKPNDDGQTSVNSKYSYRGCFELRPASNGKIALINIVDFEEYVKGVVPFEFSVGWPREALKAATIACRSFGMSYNWNTFDKYGMDILSGSSCQVYYGRGSGDRDLSITDAIVEETRGLYVTYGGSICSTCYSSCNGGRVHSAKEVFGGEVAYLQSKDDPYEQAAKNDLYGSYDQAVANSHKVGMSAWGCYAMAQYYGKDYQDILGFYYTGTHLQYGA